MKRIVAKPRGDRLDELLEQELEKMVLEDFGQSPISIPTLTKRLGLSSRSTLHAPTRKAKIIAYIDKQKLNSGVSPISSSKRKDSELKLSQLKNEIATLQAQLDHQTELMCRVVANATAKGWDVEYLLSPLRKNGRELVR